MDEEQKQSQTQDNSPKYITKCIYFPDKEILHRLESLLSKYPRSSVSTIVAQLLKPTTKAIANLKEGKRQVEVIATIWI